MKVPNIVVPFYVIIIIVSNLMLYLSIGDSDLNIYRVTSLLLIDFAFILNMVSLYLYPKGQNGYIYSTSQFGFMTLYLVIELAIGLICIWWNNADYNLLLIAIQVFMAIGFTFILLLNNKVNNETQRIDEIREKSVLKLTTLRGNLTKALDNENDRELRKVIESTFDEVNALSGFGRSELDSYDRLLIDVSEQVLREVYLGDKDKVRELCSKIVRIVHDRQSEYMKLYSKGA